MITRICLLAALLAGCAATTQDPVSAPIPAQASGANAAKPAALVLPSAAEAISNEPQTPSARLAAAIEHYRAIEASGGWNEVAAGKTLKPGMTDPRIAQVKERLVVTGELAAIGDQPDLFDEALDAAVRAFQLRHGLEADGKIGGETLAAMNVPVHERIRTLMLVEQKLATQEPAWGERYIAINIPEATYRFVENGKTITGPVIVGQKTWQTPELDSVIDRIDLNPSWTVPPRIAAAEIWPKVKKDPDYLAKSNMRLVDGKIRQEPGPGNPLGQVKFSFDNPYSVYLHDTNRRELFASPRRFRSHGCVRVSKPLALARALILADSEWTEARIADALAKPGTTRIALKNPIPVHIVYNTAWIAEDGVVHFRPDIYGRNGATRGKAAAQQLDAD